MLLQRLQPLTTVDDSVVALLGDLKTKLDQAIANGADPAKLQALSDALGAQTQRLSDAVTTNTRGRVTLMRIRVAMNEAARAYLVATLAATKGNRARAASIAGVHRSTFYRLLHRYGLGHTSGRRVNRGNAAWQHLAIRL
jgi:transcriptional regulator of acetoin/glycerol metabolism